MYRGPIVHKNGIQKAILNEMPRDITDSESLNFEDSVSMIPLLILLRVSLSISYTHYVLCVYYTVTIYGLGLPYMRYTRTDPILLLYTIVYR